MSEIVLPSTAHGGWRLKQRAIRHDAIMLALRRGEEINQDGAMLFFLGRRHLPDWMNEEEAAGYEGTTVVLGRDGKLITTYRTKRLPRELRRRGRRRGRGAGNAATNRPTGFPPREMRRMASC